MGNSQSYDPKNYKLVGPARNARYSEGTVYKNIDSEDFVIEKKIVVAVNPS